MIGNKKLIGTSVLSALAASICCIAPVFAILAGTSGLASNFAWIAPFRPYLIGLTILVLVFAWYQKLRPKTEMDCGCEGERPKLIDSKGFLFLITLFAGAMLAFPSYSQIFSSNPGPNIETVFAARHNIMEIRVTIEGMSCTGCEAHIENEVNKLEGILKVKADYGAANTIVKYDGTKVGTQKIEAAILKTGYKIIK